VSEKRPRESDPPPIETLPDPPWVRHPQEPGDAYAGFEAYRDLGPERTLSEVFRHKTGTALAQQASGKWRRWFKRYRWTERVKAWDDHLSAERQAEIEKAERERVAKWAAVRHENNDQSLEAAILLRRNMMLILRMPVIDDKESADGKNVFKVVEPTQTRTAIAGLVGADDLIRKAVADGLTGGLPPGPKGAQAVEEAELTVEQIFEGAAEMLKRHRLEREARDRERPTEPPPLAPQAPPDGSIPSG
jgi:hypothetical protein